MIYQHLFEQAGRKVVRTGLIGTGTYGISLLSQVQRIPGLDIPIICDRNLPAARKACRRAGIPDERIDVCTSRPAIQKALDRQRIVITEDADLLLDSPLDVIVECTGHPEAGAHHAQTAIRNGMHVAMVTKETDSVIGPLLNRLAQKQGVVYTPVDGDQHGLLIGLVGWARQLGLEIICGGKSRAHDYVHDKRLGVIRYGSHTLPLSPDKDTLLDPFPGGASASTMAGRKALLAELPAAEAADLCESVIAANATGLMPDTPGLHAPIVRVPEIAEVLCRQEQGGLLRGSDRIDVIGCLRRTDEAGLSGGVFAVVSGTDKTVWKLLAEKGLTASRWADCGVVFRPYHLLGVETPISILCAGLLKTSTGSRSYEPKYDLVARTTRDLSAGTLIRSVHEEKDPMIEPLIVASAAALNNQPIPFYMAVNNRINTDVASGSVLTADMIEPPDNSRLWELRLEMERIFNLPGI